jgi:hypothetical protein
MDTGILAPSIALVQVAIDAVRAEHARDFTGTRHASGSGRDGMNEIVHNGRIDCAVNDIATSLIEACDRQSSEASGRRTIQEFSHA